MDISTFIENYREAFGLKTELPLLFWYSDLPVAQTPKVNGCLFKCMNEVRAGNPVSLNIANIGCGGGQFYTGFIEFPDRIPAFVSLKERYKQTPAMVSEFVYDLGVPRAAKQYLNFARIDKVESFDGIEGLLFLATPDVLCGLTTWAYFDNNASDAVASPFGSGCSAVVTQAVVENQKQGRRTFIGFFDPSVRPYFEANILSFVIPMVRFKEMYHTMTDSCLFGTHAWGKIQARIDSMS